MNERDLEGVDFLRAIHQQGNKSLERLAELVGCSERTLRRAMMGEIDNLSSATVAAILDAYPPGKSSDYWRLEAAHFVGLRQKAQRRGTVKALVRSQ